MQIHGTHPGVAWDFVGLRGLRHIVEMEGRYADALDCSLSPSEVFPFEDLDQLDEFREWSFEMRQRFKTRGEDGRAFEFLDVGAEIEYYPDARRDTASYRPDTIMPPFNWILLAPDAGTGAYPRRHASNLHYEAAFRPREFLRLGAGGEYNYETRHEEVRELSVGVTPFEGFSASMTHTFVRGLTDAYTFGASWAFTEKWRVSGAVQYDFRVDEYVSQNAVIGRDFHDFVLEAVVERDYGRDEQRFYLSFLPKFLARSAASRVRRHAAGPGP
jgi:hypothetical protein